MTQCLFSEFCQELTDIKADRRKRKAEQTHDAEELVWKLRRDAHTARQNWRDGRRLSDKEFNCLTMYEQKLVDEYGSGALAKKVDRANAAYGHGIARTNDFGYARGQNMNAQISTDVAAAMRLSSFNANAPAGAEEPGRS